MKRTSLPNPRVQRTRVARCARPSWPLTRHPLGDGSFGQPVWLIFVELVGTATSRSIAGRNRIELGVDMRWQASDTGARWCRS
jgi:hypothetical protein